MRNLIALTAVWLTFCPVAFAAAPTAAMPWETSTIGLESGVLWQVGDQTSLSYRFLSNQLSWRSREILGFEFEGGSRLLVRHRFGLLASWIQQGPESYYVAVNGSPSLEWWNAEGTRSVFGGAGGGLGLTDSRGVQGGQGQDLTFHWFARVGMEQLISPSSSISVGILFLHMSNLGLTDPNPGIDALGFTLGYSRIF